MSRTAYHRAYYYRRLSERRASARASRRRARLVAAIVKVVCNAIDEARNDEPPFGVTRAAVQQWVKAGKLPDARLWQLHAGKVAKP